MRLNGGGLLAASLICLSCLLVGVSAQAEDNSSNDTVPALTLLNTTILCRPPIPCYDYMSDRLPCVTEPKTEIFDIGLDTPVCASIDSANEGDPIYMVTTGTATTRCVQDWKGNGRCDLQNNHVNENCEYDGGDCCVATCQKNCADSATEYDRKSKTCQFVCGEQTNYLCLDDEAPFSPISAWCQYGSIVGISQCYYTKLDVAAALQECMLSDTSHGNKISASAQCGNQTLTCTESDVQKKNGCHLKKEDCVVKPCCSNAIKFGFIERRPAVLPTLKQIYDRCASMKTDQDEPCFKYMVKCLQVNRATKGGCCRCDSGWAGWRCRTPLCWPSCVHGTCAAPNLCKCEPGWKGDNCQHAICTPDCVAGQGVCVLPDKCECFYGWGGDRCEVPVSTPQCVNGEAVSPDICRCAPGWGGRVCDYPLCQSWPVPSPDCGSGSCVAPFECQCEPGWKLAQPLNGSGYDIMPTFSKGQDVSGQTAESYVFADSRMVFLTQWDRIYNSTNAPKCKIPDCRLMLDPRCLRCEPLNKPPPGAPKGGCTECEPGFYVNLQGRCERCSNVFPHCQLCGYVGTGPEGLVVLRCTHCDPMFVLEPVTYGEDPTGRCVSDGVIEFSSTVYHIFKHDVNLTIRLQRSFYAMQPEFARPVQVLLRSRDGSAHSRSLEWGGELANFQFTAGRVDFQVDPRHNISIYPQWGSSEYRDAVGRRVQEEAIFNISIYDDSTFHPGLRYFDLDLHVPPEHLVGHQGPLMPWLSDDEFETKTGYMPPLDFGLSPTYRQAAVSTARVYIWDLEEASMPNTTCRGACQAWSTKTVVNDPRDVTITARTYDGYYSNSSRDQFLVKYRPVGGGNDDAIGFAVKARRDANNPGLHYATFVPTVPGRYEVVIEKTVPGVFAEYWMDRYTTRTAPRALPDILRVDHRMDFRWEDSKDAPSRARWWFNLHFKCIQTGKWPRNFAHAVAVHASPGTTVRLYHENVGLIDESKVPMTTKVVEVMGLNRTACERYIDGRRVTTDVADQFLCHELLLRNPQVDPMGLYSYMIEMENDPPDALISNIPVFVNLRIYHQNDTEDWRWWPVDQGCLVASGLQIQGSPFQGFEVLSGLARANTSEVKTFEDPPNFNRVIARAKIESAVRVDLYDQRGALVILGPDIIATGGLKAKLAGSLINPNTDIPFISWVGDGFGGGYYRVSFTPLEPLSGLSPDMASFDLQLHVTLDGSPLMNSPMRVIVLVSITDFFKTQILGSYTPMKANERKVFQLQTYTPEIQKRVLGGDAFWIVFHGPQHDPLPPELEPEALSVVDNNNGLYDVQFELQRPGGWRMSICPPTTTTTSWVTSTVTTSTTSRTTTSSTKTTSTKTATTKSTSTQTTSTSTLPAVTTTSTTRTVTTTTSTSTSTTTLTSTTTTLTSTTTSSSTTSTSTKTTSSTSSTSTSRTTSTTSKTTSRTTTTYTGSTTTTSTSKTSTTTPATTTTVSATTTSTTTTFTSTSSTATTTSQTTTSTTRTTTSTTVSSTTSTTTDMCIVVEGLQVYDTLSANLSAADGPGVDSFPPGSRGRPARVIAGKRTQFDVIVKDTYDVQYFEGGAQLRLRLAELSEAAGDFVKIVDHEDGSYTFKYQVCRAGNTTLAVELFTEGDWRHIKGSPFPLEVVPDVLSPLRSSILGLTGPARSGFPTGAGFELRDRCGNLPLTSAGSMVIVSIDNAVPLSPQLLGTPGPEIEQPDVLEQPSGTFRLFFTPMRRGLYLLNVSLVSGGGRRPITGSPFSFEVTPESVVPPTSDTPWLLGAVGGSSASTLEAAALETFAGSVVEVRITSRDLWGDPLYFEHDTFLLGVWRQDPAAACPTTWRCQFFAATAVDCGRIPRCRFDADNSECRPACPSPEEPIAFTLTDPAVDVRVASVRGAEYTFSILTTIAGLYHCTGSVLRPGGLRFLFYESELMHKRIHTALIQGSADYDWGRHGLPYLPIPMTRFSARIIGWLRVQTAERYTLQLETGGEAQLFVNDSAVINKSGTSEQAIGTAVLELQAGFVPIQIVVHHIAHLTCQIDRCPQDVDFYLRLSWSARSVPWEIVPVSAMYYEEPISQVTNPLPLIVRPVPRAADVTFELDYDVVPRVTIGDEVFVRLHTVDKFGNLLNVQDPTASLKLFVTPPFGGGRAMGDDLVAEHWRLTPLANGSYDLLVNPDAAPLVYNLSFELSSWEAGGVVATRGMQVATDHGDVVGDHSFVLCLPPPPQPAGTRVTCTAIPYDEEDNEVQEMKIWWAAEMPDGNSTGTMEMPSVDSVGRLTSFVPEVPGDWVIHAWAIYGARNRTDLPLVSYTVLPGTAATNAGSSIVILPSVFVTNRPFNISIDPRDRFGNHIVKTDDIFRVEIYGGYKESSRSSGEETVDALPSLWTRIFAGVAPRGSFTLDVQVLVRDHNETMSICPELVPRYARLVKLTKLRAVGSLAMLECLPGYGRASGNELVRCELTGVGIGEWRDLDGRQVSTLVCRPLPFYCPPLNFVNAELVWRDPRRDIGSRAEIQCLRGHEYVFGDTEVVCGSREGRGTWLNQQLDKAIPVVCTLRQHHCPPLESTLTNSYIVNMSADRDYRSVAHFACLPGFEYHSSFNSTFCGEDGQWKQSWETEPRVNFQALSCGLIQNFCDDPAPLLGLPDKQLEYGARIVTVSTREMGGVAEFECIEGYEYLLGETTAVCSISRTDGNRGRWMNSLPQYMGQVDLLPLRCVLVKDWCKPYRVQNGLLLSLTHEYYLRSVVTFGCDTGYEPVAGTQPTFRCGHNADQTGGAWWSVKDGSFISFRLLRCVRIPAYCPIAVAGAGVRLTPGNAWPLDSVLSMSCTPGYELSVPQGMDRLTCRQSLVPGVGQWVQHDGYVIPTSFLKCRPRQGYCPELTLHKGRTWNVSGERDVVRGSANLACDIGYRMWVPTSPTYENNWQYFEPWDDPDGLYVRCTPLDDFVGAWRDPLDREVNDLECRPVPNFCSADLPVFTRRTDMNGGTSQLPLRTNLTVNDEGLWVSGSGQHSVEFASPLWVPNLALGSWATLACNEDLKYYYSFGDAYILCGYSSDGQRGAWRAPNGRLAVPLHCYYSGTPISDVGVPPVMAVDGCFKPESIDLTWYRFGRSGAILFWLHPSAWPIGSMIIQGDMGNKQWQVWFSAPGMLEAMVSPCCRPKWHLQFFDVDPSSAIGHVRIDLTKNGTRGVDEWYHISFVWDLGLGLAGLGETKLWVDGAVSKPVTRNSDKLDSYTWVDPATRMHLGANQSGFNTTPGHYSNLRVYGRNVLEDEINAVRGSEDPRCGMFNGVCKLPNVTNAKLINMENPTDERFSLFPTRPDTVHTYECDVGYSKIEGDERVECDTSGVWTRPGTAAAATPLRCCRRAADFCPIVFAPDEAFFVHSADEEFGGVCAVELPFDPMGVVYEACTPLHISHGSVNYTTGLDGSTDDTSSLDVGSRADMACDSGYESENELLLDTVVVCYRGTFNSSVHLDGRVPSEWLPQDGRPPRLLRCRPTRTMCRPGYTASSASGNATMPPSSASNATNASGNATNASGNTTMPPFNTSGNASNASGNATMSLSSASANATNASGDATSSTGEAPCLSEDPYFCDVPDIEGLMSYIFNATLGRQLGSTVYFRCLEGYVPHSGNVTIHCVEGGEDKEDGSPGGRWVDGTLARNATELRCRPKLAPVVAPARQEPWLRTRYHANATMVCIPIDVKIHGDLVMFCEMGPGEPQPCEDTVINWTDSRDYTCEQYRSQDWCNETGGYGAGWYDYWGAFRDYTNKGHWASTACCACGGGSRGSGVLGRWVDDQGDDVEMPICVLNLLGWCPDVNVTGRNSLVTSQSLGFGFGSIALLRCEVGYEKLGGYEVLQCVNNTHGERGMWSLEPLRCGLVRHFCGSLHPINATIEQPLLNYTLGEVISFRCLRGFEYLKGDLQARCGYADSGNAGQWRRSDDRSTVEPLVCAPVASYCDVPEIDNGYVSAITSGGRLGSVLELRCHNGYRDSGRFWMDRRTLLCSHDDAANASGSGSGAFFVGLSWASRDLLRTIASVHDLLDYLEAYEAVQFSGNALPGFAWAHRLEDDSEALRLRFEQAWRFKLGRIIEALGPRGDRLAAAWALPTHTTDHVRILLRLLVDMAEEELDISAEEAREWYGAFAKLKLSFSDPATLPPKGGWLRDSGEAFGFRGNGFSYGWKCDVSAASLNRGSFNRNRSVYTDLENTLVESDPYSTCHGQEWRIRLPPGRYHVELTIQDPQSESNTSGIYLQGENMGFPSVVGPPGIAVRRALFVDVIDFLSLTCDRDDGCSTVNRITMQHTSDAGSKPRQRPPVLQCEALKDWCPPVAVPPQAKVVPAAAARVAQPLGTKVRYECADPLLFSMGQTTFVCAYDGQGVGASWRSLDGSQVGVQPTIACVINRTWCPPLEGLGEARVLEQQPPWPEEGTALRLGCPQGYQPVGGLPAARCGRDGRWCAEGLGPRDPGRGCADFLRCAPVTGYCPELGLSSAAPAGFIVDLDGPNLVHATTTLTTWISTSVAPLNAVRGLRPCPDAFRRIHGEREVVCTHGRGGQGAWQTAGARAGVAMPRPGLVDVPTVEALACELDGRYGVRRTYFGVLGRLYDRSAGLGTDVVPNVDQPTSDYDAILFETNLLVEEAGVYEFSVETTGKFVLSLDGEAVLVGRSRGGRAENYTTDPLPLEAGFRVLGLQWEFDPLLYDIEGAGRDPVPRLLRLLWLAPNGTAEETVPPQVLYHGFRSFTGYPTVVNLINDPGSCKSGIVNTKNTSDLQVGDTGLLVDGTTGLNYNPGISCEWQMYTYSWMRLNLFVEDYFEMETSPGCSGDRLEITLGAELEFFGSYCGSYAPGQVITSIPEAQQVNIKFITDERFEKEGLSIRYVVASSRDDPPPGSPPEAYGKR